MKILEIYNAITNLTAFCLTNIVKHITIIYDNHFFVYDNKIRRAELECSSNCILLPPVYDYYLVSKHILPSLSVSLQNIPSLVTQRLSFTKDIVHTHQIRNKLIFEVCVLISWFILYFSN